MKEIFVEKGGVCVSNDSDTVITLNSLGSTLAVVCSDPVAGVSGMSHCILPKVVRQGSKFPDVLEQLRLLFKEMMEKGATAANFKIMLCGCATFLEAPQGISLGVMLYKRAKAALKKNGIKVGSEHVGGPINRSVSIRVGAKNAVVYLPGDKEISI